MYCTTDFDGELAVTPALTKDQVAYLNKFAHTRRMQRDEALCLYAIENDDSDSEAIRLLKRVGLPVGPEGCYFLGSGDFGQDRDKTVVNYDGPPSGQPGLWCQWIVNEDGDVIYWDGGEKFYSYVEWLRYIVEHFLKPWGCSITGEISWFGEDSTDRGMIYAKDNKIEAIESEIVTARPSWEANKNVTMTVDSDGTKLWKNKEGQLHRTDGPAVEWADGTKEWYNNNKLHRTDGPAVEYVSGTKEWYQNGKRHRTDGPAVEHTDGTKDWYQNDKLHRIDGPAIEWANETKWYQNGKLHRTDGPAIEWASGTKEWYLEGKEVTEGK